MIKQAFTVKNTHFSNRVLLQPMEGFDCHSDGTPSDLTREKYVRAAKSCAGAVWFEACAVCHEGRSNPHQMMLTEESLPLFQALLTELREVAFAECGIRPVFVLQLTHSGRQSIRPMILYHHPIYEERRPVTDEHIVSDDYLDTLPALYASTARLAQAAGFDGVDVKACHGYLLGEALSAFTREGKYGGSFENRTRLYLSCFRAVKEAVGEKMLLCARLGISDLVRAPYGFGTTEAGEIDFTEPDALIAALVDEGLSLLNVTVGNPYFNPHVNRPYRKGGYLPPETPETGLARFEHIERHLKERFPTLPLVGSGLSFYREELMAKANALIQSGTCDFVGFGRAWLAYPAFYRDYLDGIFSPKSCCLACSGCTALMRAGKPSGCIVFREYYRNLYKEITK